MTAQSAQNLESLPAPIRRYLEHVLPAGPGDATRVRIEQTGEMTLRPGSKPRRFTATEEFAVGRVAFAWRARFPILPPASLRVLDGYDGIQGRLEVRLLGLPLQRQRGPELSLGEAFRYLAEIAWVPQAVLANRQLGWRQLDDQVVEVSTTAAGGRPAVRLHFNERDEIARTVAERPRAEAGNARTPWIGEFRDYAELGGVRVPTRGEVRWELPEGAFTYWRGTVTSLEVGADG
jgi:hypothetical protein